MAGETALLTSISIINRFYPPDPAITGLSAQELALVISREYPQARLTVYATGARYTGGREVGDSSSSSVKRVRSWYSGTQKVLRLAASLLEGIRLAVVATRDVDVVISLTDPPLVGLWIGLMRRWRRFRWIEWTMDVYPEAFVSAGLVKPKNFVYRVLLGLVSKNLPDAYICLGPHQQAFIENQRGARPTFMLPCGITDPVDKPPPDWRQEFPEHLVLAYAGNLGEAHSLQFVLDIVRRAPPEKFRVLLSLYGAHAAAARLELGELGHVIWRDRVSPADLAHADVHIACLKGKWADVCVPSKAVSSICLGRPVIFAGTRESDNWELLKDAAWLIPEQHDDSYALEDIDRVLEEVAIPSSLAVRREGARKVRTELFAIKKRGLAEITSWLRR